MSVLPAFACFEWEVRVGSEAWASPGAKGRLGAPAVKASTNMGAPAQSSGMMTTGLIQNAVENLTLRSSVVRLSK